MPEAMQEKQLLARAIEIQKEIGDKHIIKHQSVKKKISYIVRLLKRLRISLLPNDDLDLDSENASLPPIFF